MKMTKFNGFMRISKKLPKEAVPSSFGTLNCRKSIPKEAVPSSFEKPARRGLKGVIMRIQRAPMCEFIMKILELKFRKCKLTDY